VDPEYNLTSQNISRKGQKRGWFYLRIDSVVVANDVMPIESEFDMIVVADWTILDRRFCGARPIDQWNRGSDDGEGCQADPRGFRIF
jgi:hypothetical protein